MLPRLLASRGVLFFYMFQTLIMTVIILIHYVSQLVLSPLAIIAETMFDDSDKIATLLIATGVLLECREIVLKRAMREAGKDDEILHLSVMEHDIEYYGVVLLVIGLTIELLTTISTYLNEHASGIALFLSIAPAFNVITFINILLLMIAAIIAMIQVIRLMYLPQKPT